MPISFKNARYIPSIRGTALPAAFVGIGVLFLTAAPASAASLTMSETDALNLPGHTLPITAFDFAPTATVIPYSYSEADSEWLVAPEQLGTPDSADGSGRNYRKCAQKLVDAGTPYAWGGGTLDGPSQGISDSGGPADAHHDYNKIGFDCSGLARYLHYQVTGKEVPRTSQAQYAVGTEVSFSEAKPGDFVYPNSSMGSGGPGHVQVYLGNGEVVEAPQSGDNVKISSMAPSVIKRIE